MPWCPIDKPRVVGSITLIPFQRDERIDGLDELAACRVRTILACYRGLEGRPVRTAALVRYEDRDLLTELTEREMEDTRDWVSLACFSALAKRAYFHPVGPYCNADSFVVYAQRFSDEPTFTSIVSRRREGRTLDARPLADTVFSIPVHNSPVKQVLLDEALLTALVSFRAAATAEEWGRWQNAISCFNQANTDNDAVSYQVEWVLLCSACERILGAAPKAKDVAKRFASTVTPTVAILASAAKRNSSKWGGSTAPLRHEWMKEFYGVRGAFAHGKLETKRPLVWTPLEHVVLATIAFPLVARCLLAKSGKYVITDDDQAIIGAFDNLVDADLLKPPADASGSLDSVLSRLVASAKAEVVKRKAVEALKELSPSS
jgi:hypothetical protein